MHTKLKGNIGELIVARLLLENGWNVAFPYGENLKYDLIAEKDGVCKRVQVKTVKPKKGVLHVNCRSSNNWSVHHYSSKDFETLAAVNFETGKVYFIPSTKIRRSLMNIRISEPKNFQKTGIHRAQEYTNFV